MIIKYRPLNPEPSVPAPAGHQYSDGHAVTEAPSQVWRMFEEEETGAVHFSADAARWVANRLAREGHHAQVFDGSRLYYEAPKIATPNEGCEEDTPSLTLSQKALGYRQYCLMESSVQLNGWSFDKKDPETHPDLLHFHFMRTLRKLGFVPEPATEDDYPRNRREELDAARRALSVSEIELALAFAYRALTAPDEEETGLEMDRAEYWMGKAQERFEAFAMKMDTEQGDDPEEMGYTVDYREKPAATSDMTRDDLLDMGDGVTEEEYNAFMDRFLSLRSLAFDAFGYSKGREIIQELDPAVKLPPRNREMFGEWNAALDRAHERYTAAFVPLLKNPIGAALTREGDDGDTHRFTEPGKQVLRSLLGEDPRLSELFSCEGSALTLRIRLEDFGVMATERGGYLFLSKLDPELSRRRKDRQAELDADPEFQENARNNRIVALTFDDGDGHAYITDYGRNHVGHLKDAPAESREKDAPTHEHHAAAFNRTDDEPESSGRTSGDVPADSPDGVQRPGECAAG